MIRRDPAIRLPSGTALALAWLAFAPLTGATALVVYGVAHSTQLVGV